MITKKILASAGVRLTDGERRNLLEGEWKIEPPKPSPLPWTARASRARGPFGAVEIEWIIVDADGRTVGTFDRDEDARAMLSVLPGEWPARATKVLR